MNDKTFEYNEDMTTATSAGDLLKLLLLQKREDVMKHLGNYYGHEARGNEAGRTHDLSGSIKILFLEIEPMMKKTLDEGNYEAIRDMTFSDDIESQIASFRVVNQFLYDKNLLKIDTKQWYDKRRAESANKNAGL